MCVIFFFNDTATTEIYTLSLHDALPISLKEKEKQKSKERRKQAAAARRGHRKTQRAPSQVKLNAEEGIRAAYYVPYDAADRKSTRLNSSHLVISYAVFCLKKKNHTVMNT